jgi:apolipoprotein D and lipocalin family protein
MVKSIAASLLVSAAVASKCPSSVTPVCQNLDLSRYTGVWYEQVNSKAFVIDANLRCVTAEYTANDDGTVKVDNKGAQGSRTGAVTDAVGTATVKDLATCDLGVKFSALQPVDAPYQIWDTDYDTYAIVLSCIPVLNALGQSDIWILSRTPTLPQSTLDGLLQKLSDAGFDYSDMRMQEQESDCSYDVPAPPGLKVAQPLTAKSAANLVTFDGAEGTTFTFQELNDPVMGGKSTGTWSLGDGFGIFDGEVVDVPSLQAPGFIKAQASGSFPDVSAFIDGSLVLSVRTTNPEYEGYRVTVVSGATSPSFSCSAGGSLPFSRGCYKEKFSVPAGDDFVDVKIPFNTFSDKWSSATGEQTTTCADDADVCLTANKLAKIQMVELWGEGAGGKVHLEVNSISAENADGERFVLV